MSRYQEVGQEQANICEALQSKAGAVMDVARNLLARSSEIGPCAMELASALPELSEASKTLVSTTTDSSSQQVCLLISNTWMPTLTLAGQHCQLHYGSKRHTCGLKRCTGDQFQS